MNGLAPSYLSNMLNLYSPARALISPDSNILKQPKARTKYGERHFAFAAATLWNGLAALRLSDCFACFFADFGCVDMSVLGKKNKFSP
jgi:hypothetical protein